MLSVLAAALDEVEIPATGPGLRQAFALRDRFNAMLAAAVAEFDRTGQWETDGAPSATSWLRHHASVSNKEAWALAKRSRRCQQLPVLAAAWSSGQLSGGQVDAVVAQLNDRNVELFASQEADIVPTLIGLSVGETVQVMRAWRQHADALDENDGPEQQPSTLHTSRILNGRTEVSGSLDGLSGETMLTALRVAQRPDLEGEPERTPAQRRADALIDICRFFLDHQTTVLSDRRRPHINITIDIAGLDTGEGACCLDGALISRADLKTLLCSANLHRVLVEGPSAILDYGTSRRVASTAQYNALAVRDRGCRFPGCDRPAHWCDAHHVVPWWPDKGPTRLDNLVLLCRRHHHLLHRNRWSMKLLPDGQLVVSTPDGNVLRSTPPGRPPPSLPLE
ncbi:MAG: DUF222 domain-containing protein [Acidobacteria bacterium]|nr:DUF222 domain-containing protein [Acidobacteriota bacterium]